MIITNDGAMVLTCLEFQNPIAKLLVELSQSMDKYAGDGIILNSMISGTTSVVILACSLYENDF